MIAQQSRGYTHPTIKYALCDANEALVNKCDRSHVTTFDILMIMIALNPGFIYISDWISKRQPYAHTSTATWLSMCSTFNRPPGYTIWEMLKDILLSFVVLSVFVKCAALHNDGVGKILPYYPIKVRTSESAAFIFRQLVSCTIFIPF